VTDRSTILREIGLTPIWRERATQPEVQVAGKVTPASFEQTQKISDSLNATVASTNPSTTVPTVTATTRDIASDDNREARIGALSWDELVADIAQCTACKLCKTRTNTVPGVGDKTPSWMIVGEAPGENEDKRGEPFVGKAGQLLDAMLAAIGKKRGEGVYIANVIKCRPPGNRNPEADEIAACAPYLKRQIGLAQPKLLLAAGKFSAQTLLNREDTVGAMRASGGSYESVPVVVTYHPSYLLRSPLEKAKAWDDLMKAKAIVA
jgi:uracil-DNA glycosylase